MRLSGLFRTFGNIVELTVPVYLVPYKTKLLCGLCNAPRAAAAIKLVKLIGEGRVLFVIKFVTRVTLVNNNVLPERVTLVT